LKDEKRSIIQFGEYFFVRFHSFVILSTTFLCGLFISRALFEAGIRDIVIRSCTASILAYIVFFILIRLWLGYVRLRIGPDANVFDYKRPQDSSKPNSSGSSWFDLPDPGIADFADFEGCAIALLLIALFIGLIYGLLFLITQTPVILTEAAFEFLLANSLIRTVKRIDRGNWKGSVLAASWKPFGITFLIIILVTLGIQNKCPGATRIRDVFQCG
jgi:hypothetical protein